VENWLEIVIRQSMLYSLPVVVSLSMVGLLEAALTSRSLPHAFHPLSWKGAWLPCLTCIVFQRAVIFALPRPAVAGPRGACLRLGGHGLLCVAGFLLYAWSLAHPPASGLPPLHHWWAKVLMYFNLCMVFMHLVPLPGMLLGEWLMPRLAAFHESRGRRPGWVAGGRMMWLWVLLAASPLPDAILGVSGIFPVYSHMANWAFVLMR